MLNDITIDHFVKRLGVDKAKIIKVQNGVNTTKYSPLSSKEVDNFKREQGLEDKKIIFQVGSVCERKNQLGTVEMLTDYLKQNPNIVYLYAGGVIDGEYQNAIMEKARQNGIEAQVKYVGELAPGEELNRYYNAAKVSVFTSKLESFGLVIIEAISSGTPVIVGSNLMFTLDGGFGIYNNAQEFVSLVEAALENNKKTNCSRFAEGYSWDQVAKQHKYIFSK